MEAKANRKFKERGEIQAGDRRRWHQPGLLPSTSHIPRKSEKHTGQLLRELRQLLLFKFNNSSQK